MPKTGEGAAFGFRNIRVKHGISAQVRFVNDGFFKTIVRAFFAAPIIVVINDDGLRNIRRGIQLAERQISSL